jgi:RNA polymerase sigma factor (TIGR02999 family)
VAATPSVLLVNAKTTENRATVAKTFLVRASKSAANPKILWEYTAAIARLDLRDMSTSRNIPEHDVTVLLQRLRIGDANAASDLMPLIYKELHVIAARHMRHERPNHTLQSTILVHEAFLQLAGTSKVDWQSRAHFFALASRAMRRVLVDHARGVNAEKRPGAHQQVELDSGDGVPEKVVDLLALNEALERLESWDQRQSQIVEMRFFAGLNFDEIAEVMGISERTAKRDWTMARAWLHAELTKDPDGDA